MFSFLKQDKNGNLQDIFIEYAMTKNCLTNLAIEIGVNRISDVVAKCGFKIYSKNNEDISDFDYKLNVKPNPNQNATDFWKQAIHMMILKDDGCLIVNLKDNFYIADEWDCDDNVIKERTYSNVRIVVDDDEYIVNKKFKATDVVHLRYSNPLLMKLLKDSNKLVEQGWNVAINGFKSKAPKIKVSIPASLKLQDSNGNIVTSNEYAEKVANTLSQDDIKAIVSSSGIDISTIDTKNSLTSADIEKLRNEVFTTTAIALGIPKSVFNGEVTDNSNEFFTYACDPIIKIINNAMQGAWLEIDEYKNGDRIYVNCSSMKHIDVIESASNLDKLYCNGWSFNDVLDLLDKPRIEEDWADERRFTKNYSTDIEGVS